jgi:DNA-binding XRE family transcriptional regulator
MEKLGGRLKIYPRYDSSGVSLLERTRIMVGFSTSALAKEASVSRNSIWRLEKNHKKMAVRPDTALKIVTALNNSRTKLGEIRYSLEDIFEIRRGTE